MTKIFYVPYIYYSSSYCPYARYKQKGQKLRKSQTKIKKSIRGNHMNSRANLTFARARFS